MNETIDPKAHKRLAKIILTTKVAAIVLIIFAISYQPVSQYASFTQVAYAYSRVSEGCNMPNYINQPLSLDFNFGPETTIHKFSVSAFNYNSTDLYVSNLVLNSSSIHSFDNGYFKNGSFVKTGTDVTVSKTFVSIGFLHLKRTYSLLSIDALNAYGTAFVNNSQFAQPIQYNLRIEKGSFSVACIK